MMAATKHFSSATIRDFILFRAFRQQVFRQALKKATSFRKWSCFLEHKEAFIDKIKRFSKKGNPVFDPDSLSMHNGGESGI